MTKDPAGMMAELRNKALTEAPSFYRGEPAFRSSAAVGVLMETAYSNSVVTLLAFIDGAASIYFSSGGGVTGGEGHDAVRIAARRFTQFAGVHVPEMTVCHSYPLPGPGQTTFYVLTHTGVVTTSAPEEALGEGAHDFSPLFHAGHYVISQLRQVGEDAE